MISNTTIVLGLVLIVLPLILIAVLRGIAGKRGGLGSGWGGVLIVGLCRIVAMWILRSKLAEFL